MTLDAAQYLEALVDDSADAQVVVTPDGRVFFWSRGAERLFGYSASEATGADIADLIAWPSDRGTLRALLQSASGERIGFAAVRRHKTGAPVGTQVSMRALPANGPVTFITLRERDRGELGQSETFRTQSRTLAALGRLAAALAHDFNNAHSAVSAYVELIRDSLDPAHPAHKDLDRIKTVTDAAGSMALRLQAFTRQSPPKSVETDLHRVLAGIAKTLRPMLEPEVALTLRLDAAPAWVCADVVHVEQIVLNLVLRLFERTATRGALAIETRSLGRAIAVHLFSQNPSDASAVAGSAPSSGATLDAPACGLGLEVIAGLLRQVGGRIEPRSGPSDLSGFIVEWLAAPSRAPRPPADVNGP